MKVRLVVDLEVGDEPIADSITFCINELGMAPGDDDLTPGEWVGSVVYEAINRNTPPEWFVNQVEDIERSSANG